MCKSMFCNTLGISEKTIHNWITDATCGVPKGKATSSSKPAGNERRGSAKEYLQGLPNTPSHYCRSSSSKKYLEPLFASISEVYREYKNYCTENVKTLYHKTGLSELFHDLNLALFQPRKDQCNTCCSYEAGNVDEKTTYQAHFKRKNEAQEAKAADKEAAKNGPSQKVITMDLQSLVI